MLSFLDALIPWMAPAFAKMLSIPKNPKTKPGVPPQTSKRLLCFSGYQKIEI
jgi:hypothetical protein